VSVSALKIRRTRAEGTRAYLEDAVPDTSMHGDIRFSGSRLKLVGPKNKALHDETSAKMILRNEGLDAKILCPCQL
jgi:hypothetical protein